MKMWRVLLVVVVSFVVMTATSLAFTAAQVDRAERRADAAIRTSNARWCELLSFMDTYYEQSNNPVVSAFAVIVGRLWDKTMDDCDDAPAPVVPSFAPAPTTSPRTPSFPTPTSTR